MTPSGLGRLSRSDRSHRLREDRQGRELRSRFELPSDIMAASQDRSPSCTCDPMDGRRERYDGANEALKRFWGDRQSSWFDRFFSYL